MHRSPRADQGNFIYPLLNQGLAVDQKSKEKGPDPLFSFLSQGTLALG